ncbi:MAG: hypothetical protein H6727_02355 [Myxococcales bacterium]|nr:hypothetical protein [Myxococcales bacterium]
MSNTVGYKAVFLGVGLLFGAVLIPRLGMAEETAKKADTKKSDTKKAPAPSAVDPLNPIPWMRAAPRVAPSAKTQKQPSSRTMPQKKNKKRVKVRALFGSGDAPQLDP